MLDDSGLAHRGRRHVHPLAWITFIHVSTFLITATWAFGGQADWVRAPLCMWGSLGLLITFAAVCEPGAWHKGRMRPLLWLIPFAAFNALVLLANTNPSFHEVTFGGEPVLLMEGARPRWPSSAIPSLALENLWIFDSAWIPAFNIALLIRRRRVIRWLLLVAVVNAVILAIFGTAQKLLGAKGLYFGAVHSPQTRFFSTFVYHNHWGAFALLSLSVAIGLVWHYGQRHTRDALHSPAFTGLVGILLLAATIPLSTSRSSTILAAVLFGAALLHWTTRVIARRRHFHESILPSLAATVFIVLLGFGSIGYLARDVIATRVATTVQQIDAARVSAAPDARIMLYQDTWQMAKAKIWFGWGMGSFPHVFTLFNSRHSVDRLPVFYHDAHSDWLQALAEHGFVGTGLLMACALVPAWSLRRKRITGTLTMYVFGGCALVLLYAALEFPFGNFAVVVTWWVCFFAALQYARLRDIPRQISMEPPPVVK